MEQTKSQNSIRQAPQSELSLLLLRSKKEKAIKRWEKIEKMRLERLID